MRNAGLDEAQLESRLPGEISANLRYGADGTIFMAESKEELKVLLMKVRKKSEKLT